MRYSNFNGIHLLEATKLHFTVQCITCFHLLIIKTYGKLYLPSMHEHHQLIAFPNYE